MPTDSRSQADGALRIQLEAFDVPDRMIDAALDLIPAEVRALLVYGSRARQDHIDDSDLDLLALVSEPAKSVHGGDVSLSFYTEAQLRSGSGTLFGAHLARDSRVLLDPEGVLADCLSSMGGVDTARLFRRSSDLAQVLGSQGYDLPKYLPGLLREARYLLRSCLYAQAIASGDPCFSVRELAEKLGDPALVELLASRPLYTATEADLVECCLRLEAIVGPIPSNPHGSLEALIVNEWDSGSDLLAMGMLALGGSNLEFDYAEIKKVLL
ncbi:hypothetical protein [Promicromonospora sp. MEB111]|uniref:hypothetical protein n=1 Tax=Promicromonospora sp. MEB111 TaxID=3040301 RepID=UPI00254B870C|nr:hypothetical protein [Promicromonospora sp. MEB111]